MALKTSLIISGEAEAAKQALADVDQGLAKNAEAAKKLSDAYAQADKAIDRVAAAQEAAKSATVQHKAALEAEQITIREYNARMLETKTALGLVENEHRQAVAAIKQAQSAIGATAGVTRQAQAGYVNLGRQAQDVAIQLQSGTNIGTIIAQQGGQVADAVAQMGGRFAGFASFMAGPYGAAITIGIGVLVNLISEMWLASDAADANAKSFEAVEAASSGLGQAQQLLGELFDGTTGKISAQNEMLLLNAQLMANNLRYQALAGNAKAQEIFGRFESGGNPASIGQTVLSSIGLASNKTYQNAEGARGIVSGIRSGALSPSDAMRRAGALDFTGLNVTKEEFLGAIRDAAAAPFQTEVADRIEKSLAEGRLDAGLRKPDKDKGNNKKTSRGGGTAEFAEDTAAKIARIRDQFTYIPAQVQKVNEAMRQLDDLASDVERRKPPNYKELSGDIAALRGVIRDSLDKPFNDFLAKQRESAEIDKLLLAGRDDEARALQIVLSLKDQMGPLDDAQLKAVLDTVRAQREMAMVLRDQRALIDANVRGIQDLRGALEQTVADSFRGKFSLDNILRSIGNSYVQIMSQRIVEGLFGDALRQLEDQASGADKVDAAGQKIATSLGKGAVAVDDFASTVRAAIGRIDPASARGENAASIGGGFSSVTKAFDSVLEKFAERLKVDANGIPEGSGSDIVVTAGGKAKGKPFDPSGTGELFVDAIDKLSRVVGISLPKILTDSLKGVFRGFEETLPSLMAGAFTGQAASKLILGGGGSGVGGAIGGAIGQKLGEKFLTAGLNKVFSGLGAAAGPLGAIAGGLLGGVLGGVFKKTKTGGASIGLDAQGNAAVTGTSGNSADLKKLASGYGGTVNSALDRIAQSLGADLGQYAVAIGKRSSGYIKVSASGNAAATVAKRPTSDIIYDGKDEGEAIMAALANAIADGAIAGVSAAVQKALKSSPDVDKALKEALKVQDLEMTLGGIGASIDKAFRDFQRQAQERLRIAGQYGFDVVKVEERNAADRLKLSEKLLRDQVGSLQDLIAEMTSGSLFEGSAVERRNKLIEQIDAVKANAAAGVEGAAEQLARLFEQLNDVSKDAYGTTGGFAADRSLILDQARDVIASANQRVTSAQTSVDAGITQTNAALDENNDQNAQILAALGLSNDLLAAIAAANGGTGNPVYARLSWLAKTS